MRKEAKMGVRLIIMRKVKWTLIEFEDLHELKEMTFILNVRI
jgi:hypothetical protein